MYTAPYALGLYAEAFASVGALDQLEMFASLAGPRFYGLEPNTSHVTLEAVETPVPAALPYMDTQIVPIRAGATVAWRVTDA